MALRSWVGIAVLALILGLGSAAIWFLLGGDEPPRSTMDYSNDSPTTTTPSAPPATQRPSATFEPITFSGVGDKTTAPFTVPAKEFVIEWRWSSDNPEYAAMFIALYSRPGQLLQMVSCDAPHDTTYSYTGPGEMYLDVGAANLESWDIAILPPK